MKNAQAKHSLRPGIRSGLFEEPLSLSVPLPLLDGLSLVVQFLAPGQGDAQFHPLVLPVQVQGHEGISLPFRGTDELGDFPVVQQEFPRPRGPGGVVGGGGDQRGEMGSDKVDLALDDGHMAFLELGPSPPQALHLPALKNQSGLVFLFQDIVEPGPAVDGDAGVRGGFLLGHGTGDGKGRPVEYNRPHGICLETMKTIRRTAWVPHRAGEMFALVNDVPGYADFLPWCRASEELDRREGEVLAKLTLDYRGVYHAFTTRNRLIGQEKTLITLVEGPFSHLSGSWEFVALDAGSSKVELELSFDFSNPVVGGLVGPVFGGIANSLVDAFCRRADEVYGTGLPR